MKKKPIILLTGVCIIILLSFTVLFIKNKYINNGPIFGRQITYSDLEKPSLHFDRDGVPFITIERSGKIYHPVWIMICALQYASKESYYPQRVQKDEKKFLNCVNTLEKNLKTLENNKKVWIYKFYCKYNDILIAPPWYSSLSQALGIEVFLEAYEKTQDQKYLSLAKEVAEVLFLPLVDRGLLYQNGDDIWFEEVPTPPENPPHTLNGHMRTLIALKKLIDVTGEQRYRDWFFRGTKNLYTWLPYFDNGYWLRCDLNPKKKDLLFKFTNPYGFELCNVPIDKITIRDTVSKKEISVDVGSKRDSVGKCRIDGEGWGQREKIDGRTVRRLKPVPPGEENNNGNSQFSQTNFYLSLPSQWKDNLRKEWYEMDIQYKDEKAANISVEMKSIAPGKTFQELRDGDLLLSGSGKWRSWKIPIRVVDLGFPADESYERLTMQYIKNLEEEINSKKHWQITLRGYLNSISHNKNTSFIKLSPLKIPHQSPMLGYFIIYDVNYVAQGLLAGLNTVFNKDGTWDRKSPPGKAVYSPYIVARQAIEDRDVIVYKGISKKNITFPEHEKFNIITEENINQYRRGPALKWLEDNAKKIKDSLVWFFTFENSYNDIVSHKDWQSAFSQAYIIDAFRLNDNKNMAKKAAYAYRYTVGEGGISHFDKKNNIWFEEMPNCTHILNAHIKSLISLKDAADFTGDSLINDIYKKGLKSLEDYLWYYDTGYWSKYDMNPKKEILFQIDYLSGKRSPAIDWITLENPQTGRATKIDVGGNDDFTGYPRISGTEWCAKKLIDGNTVRTFLNGYEIRQKSLIHAHRHNAYFLLALPDRTFFDYFEVPTHKISIRYKDLTPGRFIINVQSINEGNYLFFVPLREGVITCTGDGRWKTAHHILRPQDMGWYMGEDYQKYHIKLLKELAVKTGNWYFSQYGEKWEYFLDCHRKKRSSVIIPGSDTGLTNLAQKVKVIDSSPMYKGYGIENSLDGDPDNNYTAAIEGHLPHFFILQLPGTAVIRKVKFIWESENHYPIDYLIEFFPKPSEKYKTRIRGQKGKIHTIALEREVEASRIKVTVYETSGQKRLLMRQLEILGWEK